MPSNIFFLLLSIVVFVLVFTQVRNQKMKEKYAVLWLVISAVIIVLALFPSLLWKLAAFTGVVNPVNLLFAFACIMLIAICLHLTLEVSKSADETRALAEEVAILRAILEQGDPTLNDSSTPGAPRTDSTSSTPSNQE
ncbi:DUF2304 domain-containing protein [Rothia nasimurium]|uniref:DUF2304 domain-containing protein n=1 Tax=Rothia nasimurium TaxID=85336 RepID=UPI001F20CA28|nr:DUF2304 domain-containing protein [Rothia nasimurium]